MLSESQKLSTYYIAFWTGFVFGHPLCAASASVTTDDPVLVACVTEIDRLYIEISRVPALENRIARAIVALRALDNM